MLSMMPRACPVELSRSQLKTGQTLLADATRLSRGESCCGGLTQKREPPRREAVASRFHFVKDGSCKREVPTGQARGISSTFDAASNLPEVVSSL